MDVLAAVAATAADCTASAETAATAIIGGRMAMVMVVVVVVSVGLSVVVSVVGGVMMRHPGRAVVVDWYWY